LRLAVLWLAACGPPAPDPITVPPDDLAPTAQVGVWRSMADDLVAKRSPADGGGVVRVVAGPTSAPVGSAASWTFRYEAGPLGVAVGGAVVFLTPPFWGWSEAQLDAREQPGFTTFVAEASGVTLKVVALPQGMIRATIDGRALAPGEALTVVYGAGPAGAVVDRYAERGERFWFGVDGDGDGVRALVANPPVVDITPGPAAGLIVTVPTTARPGQPVRVTVAALDARGNAGAALDGPVVLRTSDAMGLPATLDLGPTGRAAIQVTPREPGLYRVGAQFGELVGVSDPLLVHAEAPPVLWADLQVHTSASDGSGVLEDVYAYARDVAGLDAVAITDHDHWGMRFLDREPALWAEMTAAAARWDTPGQFVAFPAFEWTSWLYGHRHVLYVGAPGPVFGSLDLATREPAGLWTALRGYDALTMTHHQAGGPVATDWRVVPDPALEPVAEVCSVHGSSEAEDSPARIYGWVDGNSVRDALTRGYRLGLLCGTDGHDGHPGLAHLQAASGGIAGVFTADRTRAGVAAALRERRVFGTTGARLLLRLILDGEEMGGVVPVSGATHAVEVRVVAGEAVERVDLIRSGKVIDQRFPGAPLVKERYELPAMADGEWVYARVLLADGHAAWSSPIWAAKK
jgi:hypothetical protein